jgi:hypothetical protein
VAALSGAAASSAEQGHDESLAEASVAAVRARLLAAPDTEFREQQGWLVVASREHDEAVQWFFTPEGHEAHPAVVRRAAIEEGGVGMIEVAALCHASQAACDRLLDDFRQQHELALAAARPERVELDVGISLDDRERVHVKRMVAEEGLAAEIRVTDVLKMVIVPTVEEGRVLLWTAVYEFDGNDYALLGEPRFAAPGNGTATLELTSTGGVRYGFVVSSLLAKAE